MLVHQRVHHVTSLCQTFTSAKFPAHQQMELLCHRSSCGAGSSKTAAWRYRAAGVEPPEVSMLCHAPYWARLRQHEDIATNQPGQVKKSVPVERATMGTPKSHGFRKLWYPQWRGKNLGYHSLLDNPLVAIKTPSQHGLLMKHCMGWIIPRLLAGVIGFWASEERMFSGCSRWHEVDLIFWNPQKETISIKILRV